ncbi:MAG: FAD-dependent oxidoreductase [Betaproteobacteria bacterium]
MPIPTASESLPRRALASRRLWLALMLAVALFLAWSWGGTWLSLEALREHQKDWWIWQASHPWLARAAFATVYVGVTGMSLPGATVLTLAGGALFGFVEGAVLVLLAATLGATLAMVVARYLLRDLARHYAGRWHAALERGMARDGNFYLLALRLLPVFPFFAINLAMGLTQMRAGPFAAISLVGMVPATLVYVHAGGALSRLRSASDVWSADLLLALAALAALPLLLRWALPRWRARRALARWWAQRPQRFDRNLVVIGAGAGGLVTAYMASALRAKVSVIEAERPGGDCLYRGCVPSKTLIHAARQMHQARQAGQFGVQVGEPALDGPALMRRLQQVISQIEPHDSAERYTALGVEVLKARARILNPWTVELQDGQGTRQLSTRAIVVATGSTPVLPQWPGLEQVDAVTSDTLWDRLAALQQIPRRILVVGGGAIGCELSQALARLGAQLTLVEQGPQLLAQEDTDVGEAALQALQAAGVEVLLQARVQRCGRDEQRHALVHSAAGERRIEFDLLLLALGRRPRWQGLGLEALGLKEFVVDEYLETPIPGIFAAGDVTGQGQLTHAAGHQGWHAAVHAVQGFYRMRADRALMPQTLFLDPQIARVGLNEKQAQAQGLAYDLTRLDLAELDRAIIEGSRSGFIKLLTAAGSDRLLGVCIVGEQAGELLAEFTLAMNNGLGLKRVLASVHPYPTFSQANQLAAGAHRRTHQPRWALPWLKRYHAWRRGGA